MSSDGDNSQNSARDFVMSEHHRETNICRAVNEETGKICGETEGLRILEEFRQIYEARMEKIERDEAAGVEADFIDMKLKIMKEWIKDLGEQNVMLVQTVQDLEQAACCRVKILEEKLKETAGIVSEKMARMTKPNEDSVNKLSNRIYQLERDEEALKQKIDFLQSDIRGLLELLKRARCENCWSLKGIKFYEIRDEDLPFSPDCICNETADNENVQFLKRRLEVLGESEKKSRKYQAELLEKIADLDNKLISREMTIQKHVSMLKSLRNNLKERSTQKNQTMNLDSKLSNYDLEIDIDSMMNIVESAIKERSNEEEEKEAEELEKRVKIEEKPEESREEVSELRAKLEDKSLEIERLSRRLSYLEKESVETREALTNEVAEKHDMGMSLRAEVTTLEEQCRRAVKLVQFKEDIIKEMRRQLKQNAGTKSEMSIVDIIEKCKSSPVISPRKKLNSSFKMYGKIDLMPRSEISSPRDHDNVRNVLERYLCENKIIKIKSMELVKSGKSSDERFKKNREADRQILKHLNKLATSSPRVRKRRRKNMLTRSFACLTPRKNNE